MTGPMAANMAVFIDGENIPAAMFDEISVHAGRLGECLIWKVFGDFSLDSHVDWLPVCRQHGLQAVMELPAGSGKNSTDIAIVIAAMDLLSAGAVEALVLVSDDRDFLPLVRRLRAGGMDVHGFGRKAENKDLCRFHSSWTQLPAKAVPKIAAQKIEVQHSAPIVKTVTQTTKLQSISTENQNAERVARNKDQLKSLILGKLAEGPSTFAALGTWVSRDHPKLAELLGPRKLKNLLTNDDRLKMDGDKVSLLK
jgi:NYN domain